MGKFLKYSGISIFILIILIIIIPFLIPLENYKALIQTEIKKATGCDLIIKDKIHLTIIPQPEIILSNLKLSSLPGFKLPSLIEVETIKAGLKLLPLLSGKVIISYIELDRPEINLETLQDGSNNWQFPKPLSSNNNSQNLTSNLNNEKNIPFAINNFIIKKGKIQHLQNGKKIIITDLTSSLNMKSLQGPIDFNINFNAFNQHFALKGNTEKINDVFPFSAMLKMHGENIQINGVLTPSNNSFSGEIKSNGNLKNLKKLIPDLKLFENFADGYQFATKFNVSKEKISIDSIDASLGILKITGNGAYSLVKKEGNANLNLNPGNITISLISNKAPEAEKTEEFSSKIYIETPNIKPLFDNLKVNISSLAGLISQPFSLKTSCHYLNNKINFQDIIFALGDVKLQGLLGVRSLNNDSPIIFYNLETNQAAALLKVLEINLPVTINNIKIKGETTKKGDKFNTYLNQTSFVVGPETINLTGSVDLTLNKNKPNIQAALQISSINLDRLMSAAPSTQILAKNPPTAKTNLELATHWSKERIDLSALHLLEGDFNFNVKKISKGSLIFDNIKTNLQISKGSLNIIYLTADLYGGSVKASGQIAGIDQQPISFEIALKEAQLKNIAPENNKIKITEGKFNLQAQLNSKGDSQYTYIKNLFGNLEFDSTNGRLSGINLQKAVDSLMSIKNLQGVLIILDSAFAGGETVYKKLAGQATIEKGVVKLSQVLLQAPRLEASATGAINLPQYSMDIIGSIKVDIKGIPVFSTRLYGPINTPKHQLDTKALQQYLLQNVLPSIVDNIKKWKNKT